MKNGSVLSHFKADLLSKGFFVFDFDELYTAEIVQRESFERIMKDF